MDPRPGEEESCGAAARAPESLAVPFALSRGTTFPPRPVGDNAWSISLSHIAVAACCMANFCLDPLVAEGLVCDKDIYLVQDSPGT